jgi:hypothetical protein
MMVDCGCERVVTRTAERAFGGKLGDEFRVTFLNIKVNFCGLI